MIDWVLFNLNSTPREEIRIPGGTCLLGYRGSIAHNMYIPGTDPQSIDDVDLMAFVLAPVGHYLGLDQWGSRGTHEVKEGKYDCVFYEIQKAVSLLLQGNPNIVSMLWCRPEHYLYLGPAGRELVDARRLFVGRHVYRSFAGYAYAQMEKMESRDPAELRAYMATDRELKARGIHPNHKGETILPDGAETGEDRDARVWSADKLLAAWRSYHRKGENLGYLGDKRKRLVLEHGYDSKNAAHLIRLLRMCCEFLSTGELNVFREDAAELLAIKRGEWPLERIKEHASELFSRAKDVYGSSTLPDEPDKIAVGNLLVSMLGRHLMPACADKR